MKIDLFPFEQTENLKSSLRKKWNANFPLKALGDGVILDLALDRVHALNDVTRGIADLHPHKRSIATLGPLPPPLREVARGFAKQGYTVQEIKVNLRGEIGESDAAFQVAGLKKDTLFVLGCEVEPATGLYYPWKSYAPEILKKNIFTVNYFSPMRLGDELPEAPQPMEAIIIDPDMGGYSLVLKGERCVTESIFWGESVFVEKDLAETWAFLKNRASFSLNDEKTVLHFERELSETTKNVEILPRGCRRVFDRAVFFVKGVNGDALVHELASHFGYADTNGDVFFSTSDSVYWQNPHLNTWLPSLGFSLEETRTCIVVASSILPNPRFKSELLKSISTLQKISGTPEANV